MLARDPRARWRGSGETTRREPSGPTSVAALASLVGARARGADGLVAGKANKVIAYDLDISPRTVEIYRANVMTKMRAHSLSELVRMSLVAGVT